MNEIFSLVKKLFLLWLLNWYLGFLSIEEFRMYILDVLDVYIDLIWCPILEACHSTGLPPVSCCGQIPRVPGYRSWCKHLLLPSWHPDIFLPDCSLCQGPYLRIPWTTEPAPPMSSVTCPLARSPATIWGGPVSHLPDSTRHLLRQAGLVLHHHGAELVVQAGAGDGRPQLVAPLQQQQAGQGHRAGDLGAAGGSCVSLRCSRTSARWAAPMTSTASPLSSVKIAGHMEDMGLLPGLRGVVGSLIQLGLATWGSLWVRVEGRTRWWCPGRRSRPSDAEL